MSETFDLEDFNMIDMTAKKVLEALAETNKGIFVKGEEIHIKTGLTPEDINYSVKVLAKSLLIDISTASMNRPPYEFYATMITDFGRQVLEKFG
ncbi:MAG: hypothetical protein NWE92_02180 [Candidatus Bathyarchaeota archaeon]|nr:hypothetical protein [Candidatus Bathyarchaeota archaeon]